MSRHFDMRAIALGVAVDLVGSVLLALVLLSSVSVYLSNQGLNQEQIQHVLTQPTESLPLTLLILLTGACADYCAGYITGKFAKVLEVWHALGMISIVLMLHFAIADPARLGVAFGFMQALIGVTAALWGGFRAKQSKNQPAS